MERSRFAMNKYVIPILLYLLALGCKAQPSVISTVDQKLFSDHWYQGKAELSSYDLTQSRYGATHDGKVVLVYVTEDMSNKSQVKLDDPSRHVNDAIKVMKLNTMKEFVTGIYKYSMMMSVFTPVEYVTHPHSLKLTCSSQEWCGQYFMQANWKGNRYEVKHFSYFESEGDQSYSLMNPWLEDEVWTKIRVAPNTLLTGELKMVPSAFYIRMSHQPMKVYDAVGTLIKSDEEYTYKIEYRELKRILEITFQAQFPYKILGWKEVYGENEITTAKLSSTIMSDYWNHNRPKDELMRNDLNLED